MQYPDHITIKNWAEEDRPREKLLNNGPQSLSNAELIAILLGSGSKNETAVELAKRILSAYDNHLGELGRSEIEALTRFRGVGEAKALSLLTALELGKRRGSSESLKRGKITSSREAFESMYAVLGDLPHEEFWVLFLSNANRIITKSKIGMGGLTGTVADIRLIFNQALRHKATAMILFHNHPSGNLKPSSADKDLTRKLCEGGRIMDIRVLDHLIIGHAEYFSFADEGIIDV